MFLESLYEAFNEVDPETGIIKGKDAIRRVRDEEPAKFIACIVGLMPKEITGADGDALKTEIIYRWATPEQQAMPEPDPPPE